MTQAIPTIIAGATGYVGGEMLRLLTLHPDFSLGAALSRSETPQSINEVFPHLGSAYRGVGFQTADRALDDARASESLALFSAAPHGGSAELIEPFLEQADKLGTRVHVVDASADYRYESAPEFSAVYGVDHAASHRLSQFYSALPEHQKGVVSDHVGNPGCFATGMLLASVPLVANKQLQGDLFATGITGSTGSGKLPLATTHHPVRHSNLYTYKALAHRHVPEVEALIKKATGQKQRMRFVPHSGPFARGIHMTLQGTCANELTSDALNKSLADYYSDAPFVEVVDAPPRIKDVAGSNYAKLHGTVADGSLVVVCVIDNLLKGAAGSAFQWMNRLFNLPETSGLDSPAPGWI